MLKWGSLDKSSYFKKVKLRFKFYKRERMKINEYLLFKFRQKIINIIPRLVTPLKLLPASPLNGEKINFLFNSCDAIYKYYEFLRD